MSNFSESIIDSLNLDSSGIDDYANRYKDGKCICDGIRIFGFPCPIHKGEEQQEAQP